METNVQLANRIVNFLNDEEINIGLFQINVLISDIKFEKYTIFYQLTGIYLRSIHSRIIDKEEFRDCGKVVIEILRNKSIKKTVRQYPELGDDKVMIPYLTEIFNHICPADYKLKYYSSSGLVHWYDQEGYLETTVNSK